MTYQDELWNLAFSNVGRLHGEPRNQQHISRAIHAISGFAPTNQKRQRTTGRCQYDLGAKMLTQCRRRESNPTSCSCSTSQSHESVNSSSKASQQYSRTRSSYQYVYWQPNVKGPGGTAANNITPSPHNYPASHGIPGRRPRSLYGAAQPWRLGR